MSDLIKMSGLWVKTGKSGEKYFSGTIANEQVVILNKMGSAKIMILKNKFKKEGDKAPEYNLFITANEKKDEATTVPQTAPYGFKPEEDETPF